MENIFSFKRLFLLLKSNMIETWRYDLRFFLSLAGFIAFFRFCEFYPDCFPINFVVVCVALVLGGVAFCRLSNQPSAIAYLNLPASTLEKTVTILLKYQVFYVAIIILANLLGFWVAIGLREVIPLGGRIAWSEIVEMYGQPKIDWTAFGWALLGLTTALSAMLFGSVYFRKRTIVKIALTFVSLTVVFVLLNMVFVQIFPDCSFDDIDVNINEKCFVLTFCSLTTLFFWFMTWLRLRETEA